MCYGCVHTTDSQKQSSWFVNSAIKKWQIPEKNCWLFVPEDCGHDIEAIQVLSDTGCLPWVQGIEGENQCGFVLDTSRDRAFFAAIIYFELHLSVHKTEVEFYIVIHCISILVIFCVDLIMNLFTLLHTYCTLYLTVWLSIAVSVSMIPTRIVTTNTESQRVRQGKHLIFFLTRFVIDLMDFTRIMKQKGHFTIFSPCEMWCRYYKLNGSRKYTGWCSPSQNR